VNVVNVVNIAARLGVGGSQQVSMYVQAVGQMMLGQALPPAIIPPGEKLRNELPSKNALTHWKLKV